MGKLMKGMGGLCVAFLFLSLGFGASYAIERDECLECHGSRDILEMSEAERLELVIPTPGKKEVRKGKISLFVDADRFEASVHGELECVDCHTEIEELPHPQHMGAVDCGACHEEVVEQYQKSKHAKVSERLCYECHNPHYTRPFRQLSVKERISICLQCHKGVKHEWLPQQAHHLEYLECTVCHSPKAVKAIAFFITAEGPKGERRPLTFKELKSFLGGRDLEAVLDSDGDGVVEVDEVNSFLDLLKGKGVKRPRLREEVLVIEPYHNFTDEVEHIKDCTMCHTSEAPFYSHVLLRVPKDGQWFSLKMDRAILAKIPSIPAKDYYYRTVHGQNGVECIDCHADLRVLRVGEGFQVKALGEPVCEKCHEDIMEEYKNSLHYKVSKKICYGCHDPHSAVPFSQLTAAERRAICEKCHLDVEKAHDWLPQKEVHFRYLECTMCHSPQAEKGIVFYIRGLDKRGGQCLSYKDLAELMDVDSPDLLATIDRNGDGMLEVREVLDFLKLLNFLNEKKGKRWQRIDFGVNVLVLRPSHNYTDKGTGAKKCAVCHSSRAAFYSKVVLELPEKLGVRMVEVDKEILVGIHPIPVTGDFYLLGESRISKKDIAELFYIVRKIGYKWLDIIGVFFIFGSVAFVALHSFLRILTIRARKRRNGGH